MQYFQHYKGNYYRIIGEAKHSESLEPMIVYQALYKDMALWVRPKDMFFENVTLPNGQVVPRFRPCPEDEALAALNASKAGDVEAPLLDHFYSFFHDKGYVAEDFFGGCSLCGEPNEFIIDAIDSQLRDLHPNLTPQQHDDLVNNLYSALHKRFEADEA
ncbi:MAG: DUF1653 domain-containing protein [Bacteroidales bacterium]|nr:DUF1653 domain-containing protein [Bacteroidales bacterium]